MNLETVHSRDLELQEFSDEELMQKYQVTRSRTLFDEIVHRHDGQLRRHLVTFLKNDAFADDATQNTWLKIWRKPHLFDCTREFRPWLYGVAYHVAVDLLRSNKHWAPLVSLERSYFLSHKSGRYQRSFENTLVDEGAPQPVDTLLQQEKFTVVQTAIEQLTENLRPVLRLSLEGRTYDEIAQELSIPTGTVKSRIHTARTILRQKLELYDKDGELALPVAQFIAKAS